MQEPTAVKPFPRAEPSRVTLVDWWGGRKRERFIPNPGRWLAAIVTGHPVEWTVGGGQRVLRWQSVSDGGLSRCGSTPQTSILKPSSNIRAKAPLSTVDMLASNLFPFLEAAISRLCVVIFIRVSPIKGGKGKLKGKPGWNVDSRGLLARDFQVSTLRQKSEINLREYISILLICVLLDERRWRELSWINSWVSIYRVKYKRKKGALSFPAVVKYEKVGKGRKRIESSKRKYLTE